MITVLDCDNDVGPRIVVHWVASKVKEEYHNNNNNNNIHMYVSLTQRKNHTWDSIE